MESKELIQSCFHAKAWSFICSVWKIYGGGGGGSKWLPLGLICYIKKPGRPRVKRGGGGYLPFLDMRKGGLAKISVYQSIPPLST